MIKLNFIRNNEIFSVTIIDKEIWYSDRKMNGIRLIPKDIDFHKKIIMSRNGYPAWLEDMTNLSKEEQDEYSMYRHDEFKLREIVIRDVKKIGGKLIGSNNI